jgi:myo-inositol 2-dehydrogenase/D-chiro-inositol 1-dehydrogenase
MKFAILGSDPHCQTLTRLIEDSRDCQIVWRGDQWDDALLNTATDAIVVGHVNDESALRQLIRRLVELRKPLVLSHPVNLSVMALYEIEIQADNADIRVIPVWPLCDQDSIDGLFATVKQSNDEADDEPALRTIQQVRIARFSKQVDCDALQRLFACDMATLRPLVGDLSSVSAMSLDPNGHLAIPANVQMTGPNGILVHWSVAPIQQDARTTIAISGDNGGATLTISSEDHVIEQRTAAPSSKSQTWSPAEIQPQMLLRLCAALRRDSTSDDAIRPRWGDATRSLELTEALQKSLKKKRQVHLNYEGRGEENAFKGTMASLGCALLCGGLLLIVVTAVLSRMAELHGWRGVSSLLSVVPYLLLAALVVFLLAQLLRFVIPVKNRDG